MKYIIYISILVIFGSLCYASLYSSTNYSFDLFTVTPGNHVESTSYEMTAGIDTGISEEITSVDFSMYVGYFTYNETTKTGSIVLSVPIQVNNLVSDIIGINFINISWNITDVTTEVSAIYLDNSFYTNVAYPIESYNITGLSAETYYNITVLAYNASGYNTTNSSENNILVQTLVAPPSLGQRNVVRRIMTNNTANEYCDVFKNDGTELCINETDYNNSLEVNQRIRFINGIIQVLLG